MNDPTPMQLEITKRVGNRLSERLPSQGVMDWTDVQQFALEALLGLIAAGDVPDEPAWLGARVRSATIDLLRKHGVLVRLGDGSYMQPEAPELDSLPAHIREAIILDDELPTERGEFDKAPGRKQLQKMQRRTNAESSAIYRAKRTVSGELTEREVDILSLIADGLSYVEAGKRAGISRDTVNNHLARARLALRTRSNAHSVAVAFRRGLLA